MNTLELARPSEADACYEILDMGREFQKEQGFIQWDENYPTLELVHEDIACGKGYVVKSDGVIAGYLCIDFDGEPAYEKIDGAWRYDEPYAVVHRMAFHRNQVGKGLASDTFRLVQELALSRGVHVIRIDTHFPNKRMQHVLTKNGFVNTGVIRYQEGERLAYDKKF